MSNNKDWGFYGPRDDEYYHATYHFYVGDMDHHI